ncbi:MAG TPA: hypothetical protein VGR57_07940 [Ktedonobacterales bacterium]|nr:hypothetical protein [Ktedonobacterales bacterium]
MEAREPRHRLLTQLAHVADIAQNMVWLPQGRTAHQLRARLRLIAAVTTLVAALFACGAPPTIRLSTAPAAQLYLDVRLQGALIPSANVVVVVAVHDAQHATVEFTNHQRLTVNGKDRDPSLLGGNSYTIPRPPAGGSYTIAYTDENGHQTSVIVPAPARTLAITSPAAHAQIPIPQVGAQLDVQYAVPYPAPSALAQAPFRTQVDAGVEGRCKVGRPDGIATSALSCINVGSAQVDASGDAVISDTGVAPGMGFGFDNLAAGPGELYVQMSVAGTLPQSGFGSVLLTLDDVASLPITWV